MKDIKKIIKKIDKLKPIPQVTHRIMSIVEDPDSSMSQLTDVIVYDQALTANLLRVCNSAYLGLSSKVESVHQAIVYLGLDQLVDLVLVSCGSDNFKRKQNGYDLGQGELWKYSVSSALLAKALAEKIGLADSHRVFTAALIKDIGKVVLNQHVADTFDDINFLVSVEGLSFEEAEKQLIGIDHAELGAIVAEKWKFSSHMVDIIRHHHLSDMTNAVDSEIAIVYLADTLCMMMGIGGGADALYYRFHKDVVAQLGFSEVDIMQVIAEFGENLQFMEDLVAAA